MTPPTADWFAEWQLAARVPDRRAAAVGLAAVLVQYAALGLSRQGASAPDSTIYAYFGAAFLLPVFASAWPAVPRWGRPAVVMLAAVALTMNALELIRWAVEWPAYIAG